MCRQRRELAHAMPGHQRDRASIMLEMGDVVRRCSELPCHDITAPISIATQVNDTLHEPSRISAEDVHTRSYGVNPPNVNSGRFSLSITPDRPKCRCVERRRCRSRVTVGSPHHPKGCEAALLNHKGDSRVKLPVNVTEPNGIKFALAIIADAKRAAINNFSFMLLVSLTCTNYARVKVVGRFGDKYVLFVCSFSITTQTNSLRTLSSTGTALDTRVPVRFEYATINEVSERGRDSLRIAQCDTEPADAANDFAPW